jgi:hypothetical protein
MRKKSGLLTAAGARMVREDWDRPLAGSETIEIPVRRARWVFYLTGVVVFAGLATYAIVTGDQDPMTYRMTDYKRLAFSMGIAGLGLYAAGALRLCYGILTGRSRLTIGRQGIALGARHLDWADIQDVTLRPTSPVLRYLAVGPPSVRIQARQARHHIDVTRDHVKNLDGFAEWLRGSRQAQTPIQPPS